MSDIIEVFKIEFDGYENIASDAISKESLGVFGAKGTLSPRGHACEFIASLEPQKLYLEWDGEVYPQIVIEKKQLQEGE